MHRIYYKDILKFHQDILTKIGLDNFSVESVSKGLCDASLRGVDSHGIRLLPHYVDSASMGRKNPKPNFVFKKNFPSVGILDADNAFGHAAGMKAIKYGIEIANEMGMGAVAVKNSSHPGALASIALIAAKKGYLCFAFTHADALMLSHNGKRPYFGTNPICFAAPRKKGEPYCLDMATSMISWNKLLNYRENNKILDKDFAADKNGKSVNDPKLAVSLLPAGSYKGYGLASMVEILCGVFTGMAFGRNIAPMFTSPIDQPRHLGQFYIIMRADGCIDQNEFINRMQMITDEVRSEPALDGEKVMLPNDIEIAQSIERNKNGIPLDNETYLSLKKLSEKYNIPLKLINGKKID